jgi:phage antirepressor YoqD-like protein
MFNENNDQLIALRVQEELEKLVKDPLVVIKAYQQALTTANNKIIDMQPKVECYDIMVSSESLFEMSAVAKIINFKGFGRNNLFEYLRHKKIMRYNNEPYQDFVDRKYFKVVEQNYSQGGRNQINRKTMATQKGIDYITKILLQDGYELNDR